MAILQTGYTWPTSGTITSTNLNNSVNNATFASGAVDGSSTALSGGAIAVKDGGVTAAKLANSAVTPAKIKTDELFQFDKVAVGKARVIPLVTITSSSTLSLDLDVATIFEVRFSANITSVPTVANQSAGQSFLMFLKPTGGNYSVSGWSSNWKWSGGITPSTTGTAGSVDIVSGISDGTNLYVSILKGFA